MTSEPRKASDIILELEKKLDVALSIIRTLDLNVKILSNKLNTVAESIEKKSAEPPKIIVEAINTAPQPVIRNLPPQVQVEGDSIMISSEDKLPLEMEPKGFRRTSRPETFAGDDVYLNKSSSSVAPRYPVQTPAGGPPPPPGRGPNTPPPGREAVAVVPAPPPPQKVAEAKPVVEQPKQAPVLLQNAVPVMQRVTNAHGKSLFLADVEIIDLATMQPVTKTRTNGTGKWMASLGIGDFRIIIRKLEAATKQRLEFTQDIKVDGTQSPLELQTVIVKA